MERIAVETGLLDANDAIAARNRDRLERARTLVVNLLSGPGAGKTALLEALLPRLTPRLRVAVIEGDLATTLDADRIAALGIPAHQITTGTLCHLEADQVERALDALGDVPRDLLFVENVGNLVCPANFDLGERLRVAVLSTPEGDDKPRKYPVLFHGADAVAITKTDLLPHLDVTLDGLVHAVRRVNAHAPIFPVSARTGAGIDALGEWIEARRREAFG